MRKFFVEKTDTHRISLDEGQWIDILSVYSRGLSNKASRAAMSKVAASGKDGDDEVTVDIPFDSGAFNDTLLKEMIVDWSFTDDAGVKVPVTQENILRLANDITSRVIKEINTLGRVKTEPEKNAS